MDRSNTADKQVDKESVVGASSDRGHAEPNPYNLYMMGKSFYFMVRIR